jgi:hypothetical protein
MSRDTSVELTWTQVQRKGQGENEASLGCALEVSNAFVPLPKGLWFQGDFLGRQEEEKILEEINEGKFMWEGFDERRRVQRYSFYEDEGGEPIPQSLVALRDRLHQVTGRKALQLAVEECAVAWWSPPSKSRLTTFESGSHCSCHDPSACSCFVAQIPLGKAAIQHVNKPLKRQANCWDLESPDHWTDVLMGRGSLLIKTGDCLWNWRSQLKASPVCSENVYLVTFYTLPTSSSSSEHPGSIPQNRVDHPDQFGYVPSGEDRIPLPDEPMPPIEDLLTIIITTSPIKSNPSTEVIEKAMQSFLLGGPDFAYKCRKVIVCDGVRTKGSEGTLVSQKHNNIKQAMRNGIVTNDQAGNYTQYKESLKVLCETASESSPFYNTVVEELLERQGYGYALRHALRNCVSTQFVCVVQHDRTFMRPTPVRETVEAMWRHAGIKYVGMSMRSNLMYRDIFLTKYGHTKIEELSDLSLRVPELKTDNSLYGPNSQSTAAMSYSSEKLRANILALVDTYRSSAHAKMEEEWNEQNNSVQDGKNQMSLTPTLFWYDNVHICETEHYRDFVFHPDYKMVARGGFVEDKLSPVLKRTVERLGLKEGHSRFGCYLLDDHSGMFFTGHLDGGSYMTSEERTNFLAKKDMP